MKTVLAASLLAVTTATAAEKIYSGPPIRALLVTGGGFHDYAKQTELIRKFTQGRANIEWTVVHTAGGGTRAEIPLYDDPAWAKDYDVVVHNACFADTDNLDYVRRILAAHRAGTPAVVIHCAMHCYRALEADDWREFLGVTSRRHEKDKGTFAARPVAPDHPALAGFPQSWTTPLDELYVVEKLWPRATALVVARNPVTGKDEPIVWTNDYHGTRVFGTTLGHDTVTFEDPVFADTLARGIVWAAGR
jgi:type 1 glutamine amidotransferase